MKTRYLQVAFALSLAAVLAGCGGGDDVESDRSNTESARQATEPTAGVRTRAGEQAAPADDRTEPSEDAQTADDDREEMAEDMAEDTAEDMSAQTDEPTASVDDSAGDDSATASAGDSGDPCVVDVEVGDSIAYSRDSITVPSSCESVTINMAHTGSLPREAMGHNWVLVPASAVQAIGSAGGAAGMENDYLPDDDRIVAASDLIGGGQSTSLTFSLDDLDDGTDYAYVCTFPGHWSVMRGTFTVE